jgi:hypothetical protein
VSQEKAKIDRDPRSSNFCTIHLSRLLLNLSMILRPRPGAIVIATDPLSTMLHCAIRPGGQELDSNLVLAARKSMPRRIDDELGDDHCEAPTTIRAQPQRLARKQELMFR